MKLHKPISLVAAGLLLLGAAGCTERLEVENPNAPDTERALATPGDIESLIAGSFLSWWNVNHEYGSLGMALQTMAEEGTSSWGNGGMRFLSSVPRQAVPNQQSWSYAGNIEYAWFTSYQVLKAVYDGLTTLEQENMTITDGGTDVTPRAKAFGKFVQGLTLGTLGTLFDRAFILTEDAEVDANGLPVLELKPYNEVIDAAVASLEEAIQLAEANEFTLPSTWINGLSVDNERMIRLAHSYIARFMAWEARTPEERQAADWDAIIAHIDQGIQEDFAPLGDGAWTTWYDDTKTVLGDPGWGRADLQGIGVADTSGNYEAWMATDPESRQPFVIHTPDRRIAGTDSATAPGAYFEYLTDIPFDPGRGTYHLSNYWYHALDHGPWTTNLDGPMVDMRVVEMKLLKAEGLYYKGLYDQVAAMVNETRVANGGLEPVTENGLPNSDNTCVPKKMHTTTGECGDLFDALKYEKRMETYRTAMSTWFFDSRGWGELQEGTPLHFPIPAKELNNLQMEIYTFGGVGGNCAAAGTGCTLPGTSSSVASDWDFDFDLSVGVESRQ